MKSRPTNQQIRQNMSMENAFESIPAVSAQHFDRKYRLIAPELAQGKVVIMLYRDTCPHCVHFKPNYASAAANPGDVKYVRMDTSAGENQALLNAFYDDKSDAPFVLQGVPTVVGYFNGAYYSMYGPGDRSEPEYRSVEGVQHYGAGLGSAPVSVKQD